MATYAFPDAFGGAERFIHGLAMAQAAMGHEVTVLTGNVSARPAKERLDGLDYVRYPLAPLSGFRFSLEVHRQVTGALRTLANRRFDILHTHQIASALPALGSSFPARRVLNFHASHQLEFEAERPMGFRNRIKSMAIGVLDRRCLQRAERVVVHTDFVRSQVESLLPAARDRLRIIPAGVDFARFSPGDRGPGRRLLGVSSDTFLVVCVRRLMRRMGIDLLLRAIATRVADHRVVVAIGGVGPELGALTRLVSDLGLDHRVRFLGRIPDAELPDLLRAADLVVVPSRAMEGFGMSTVEGLACGTPVIATAIGASPEILSPIDSRLLVPPEAQVLGERIAMLLHDPEYRGALGIRGAESVRARFSWSQVTSQMNLVYGELLAANARPRGSPVSSSR